MPHSFLLSEAKYSLDSKAVHEIDVVPEGSVDVQVYLFDLCGESTSLLLHFLEDRKRTNVLQKLGNCQK